MFHGRANLVLVDVVVTEKDKAVHGLDRSRFHIFEDGKEQTITSFDEHQSASVPVAVKAEPLPPHTYSNTPVYPPASAVNVLLLDALNTPLENQMGVRHQMIEFMGKIPPGTPLAIFILSSKLRLLSGFSTDAAAQAAELKTSRANPQMSSLMIGAEGLVSSPQEPKGEMAQLFDAHLAEFQAQVRTDMTLDALQQLAAYLSAIPGRKNIVWFTAAFPLGSVPGYFLFRPYGVAGAKGEQIQTAADMLTAARIAIYLVDARGLTVPSRYSAADNSFYADTTLALSGKLDGQRQQQLIDEHNRILSEQNAMQQFAEETGGRAFVETNDLDGATASAIDSGSNYYTIGYAPASAKLDGKFHKTEVRIEERKAELAYRHGYYADTVGKYSPNSIGRPNFYAEAVEFGAPQETEILFKARVLPAADPLFHQVSLPSGPGGEMTASIKGPKHRSIVDLTLDAHGLALDSAADGTRQGSIHLTIIAYDADGQRVNSFDHGYQLALNSAQYEQALAKGIFLRQPIDLPAGQIFLRIAVYDLNASHAGSLEIPLQVAMR